MNLRLISSKGFRDFRTLDKLELPVGSPKVPLKFEGATCGAIKNIYIKDILVVEDYFRSIKLILIWLDCPSCNRDGRK